MLSDKQQTLLAELRANPGSTTGHLEGELGAGARQAMTRLESRGFVRGDGVGATRKWWVTGDAPSPHVRGYVVLQEGTLLEALLGHLEGHYEINLPDEVAEALRGVEVYVKIGNPSSRNTEHAFRAAAREAYPTGDPHPTLVAVAERHFQPTPVKVNNRQTVSVG